jgi:ABC-2 type transport system permease protein
VSQSVSPTTRALLAATVDAAHQRHVLGQAGVPLSTVLAAQTPVPLRTVVIRPPPPHKAARDIAALAAGFLLYLAVGIYGGAVATGAAQEKSSRTAEVLLAAVRPRQLLAGKVIGIGLCGLGQLAIPVVAGLIANAAVHSAQIPSTIWLLLPPSLLWFALGYAFYSFGFAAAGATVARQEEVQFATAPLAAPLIAGYLLVYAVIASPNATWIHLLSYLPPLAPTLMPARLAIGGVAWWETPLDVLIMLIAVYGMIRLAARVYTGALVRGGARLSWRAALRLRERGGGSAP